MAPSEEIAAEAARRELGRLEAVYGNRRPLLTVGVWVFVGAAVLLALLFTSARLVVPAVLLAPVALVGVLAYRRWKPPAGDPRSLAVYEHGFVDAAPGRELVAVRWDEVTAAEPAPPPVKGMVLTLSGPGSARVWLTGLDRQEELFARLAQRTPTRAQTPAQAQAQTPAPAPTRAGADRRGVLVLAALALAPAVLYPIVGAFDSEPVASPSSPTSTPSVMTAQLPSPSPSPSLDLPYAANSRDLSGYSPVCGGRRSYSGAAAYTGKGPHPVAFFESGNDQWQSGMMATDRDNALDKWQAKTTLEVQLIACIATADGPTIRGCGKYTGGTSRPAVTVTLKWGDYTITLYEAKTGRKVAGPVKIRGKQKNECPALIDLRGKSTQHVIRTELSGAQVRTALARYLG